MNRAIHTATPKQRGIGRVDDRINVQLGNVRVNGSNRHVVRAISPGWKPRLRL